MKPTSITALALLFATAACYGADSESTAGLGRAALIQTVIGLGVVIAVIYALAWLAKRTNVGSMGRDKGLKVVSVLPLGTREKAVLVDIAGTQMLLGVAPGRVSTLHVFPEPVVSTSANAPRDKSSFETSDFAKKLNDILRQGTKS